MHTLMGIIAAVVFWVLAVASLLAGALLAGG
jgi:hypothetical protein